MDARDEVTWLVVELTPQGESAAEDGTLESLLRDHGDLSPSHPIFIPCLSYEHRGRRSVLSVMEGYAFIASGLDGHSISLLSSSPYVQCVMSRGSGIRKVHETVPDASVQELRMRLNEMVGVEIREGMQVRVNDGPLAGLIGKVVELDGDQASVLVEMRSLNAVKDFPRFLLCPVGDGDE